MNESENFERRIDEFRHHRPQVICCKGPTGPTERLFKSSNSIIIDSS